MLLLLEAQYGLALWNSLMIDLDYQRTVPVGRRGNNHKPMNTIITQP